MKSSRAFSALALIAVVVMTLAACSAFRDTSTLRSRWCLVDSTEIKSLTYEMCSDMQKIEVRFEVLIDKGSLAWELTDPEGVPRWEGEINAAHSAKDERTFDALDGEWTMELDLDEFTGKGEVYFKAW